MATYYILPTGNDTTGDGTSGNPWQTISKAYSSSASGDTIYLLPDSVNTYQWQNLSFATARTITSGDVNTAVIDGTGATNTWMWTCFADMTFSNITFQNITNNFPAGVFDGHTNVITVLVTNCKFKNISYAGGSIFTLGRGVSGQLMKFTSCLFENITMTDGNSSFLGETYNGGNTFEMVNCTSYVNAATANTPWFFNPVSTSSVLTLINNIIVNANGTDKDFLRSTTVPLFTGTSPTTNIILGYGNLPAALSTVLVVDPLFVDAAGGVFNLRPDSPAIGIGDII